jgi:hypothetical protein
MAKKKMRKFADGGLSSAQEEWLGGADRTDPYILARMRSAVPDVTKDTYENNAPYKSDDQGLALTKEMVAAERAKNGYANAPVTKTVTRTSVTASPNAIASQKPTPETPEEYKTRMQGLEKRQALENVSPEDYVTPGGILKGMFKRIASKGLKTYTAKEIADMVPKMIGRESLKLGREPLKLGMKRGGSVKKMASGGTVSSASKRADGIATKGKTRGKMC